MNAELQTEQKIRDLLEAAPDAMVIVNERGEIVLINAQTERLFGYTREELLGRKVETLVPVRHRKGHETERDHYAASPLVRPMGTGRELFGLRKDGSEFPVEISLSPIHSDVGVLVTSAIRDISERKRFERELQAKNAELELFNSELESFCYSISHDLRAPIRAMHGFAGILATLPGFDGNDEAKVCLDRIRENATRMGELVDALLRLARYTRHPLVKAPDLSVNDVVAGALREVREGLSDRSITFNVGDLPSVAADASLLHQVFVNLIANAVKYTRGKAPAVIKIGSRQTDSAIVYYVQDNGVGFSMEYATKLFRVFQRLHSPQEFEGTGVGLAIVQKIIHRHGGRIWPEAKVGEGATFFFTLGEAEAPCEKLAP